MRENKRWRETLKESFHFPYAAYRNAPGKRYSSTLSRNRGGTALVCCHTRPVGGDRSHFSCGRRRDLEWHNYLDGIRRTHGFEHERMSSVLQFETHFLSEKRSQRFSQIGEVEAQRLIRAAKRSSHTHLRRTDIGSGRFQCE